MFLVEDVEPLFNFPFVNQNHWDLRDSHELVFDSAPPDVPVILALLVLVQNPINRRITLERLDCSRVRELIVVMPRLDPGVRVDVD